MSERKCRRLATYGILEYEGQQLPIEDVNKFAFEMNLYGTQRDANGNCVVSPGFTLGGQYYARNYAIAEVTFFLS